VNVMTDHYLKTELLALLQQDPRVFRFLDEGVLDGIFYLNAETFEDEWYSPQFKALFGYEDDEIGNTTQWWQDNIFSEDLERVMKNYEAHLADPDNVPYEQTVRYRHKDGSTVWVRCRGLVIKNEEGVPVRLLGAHTDVSDIARTEETLAAKVVALEQANRELEQFAYLASHDLQEPLRMVASFSKMISDIYGDGNKPLDEQGQKWLGYMCEGAQRMQKLINSLLALSRIKDQTREMELIDMSEVMGEIVTDLAVRIHEKNAKILTGNLPAFYGVHSQVRQVFQNLLSNALKFNGDDPPVVRIRGDEIEGGMVQYTVQDEGIGIPQHDRGKVFDAFYRARGSKNVAGSGIGLSITKKIVTLHGGTIRCESEPGHGTTFFVTFKATAP